MFVDWMNIAGMLNIRRVDFVADSIQVEPFIAALEYHHFGLNVDYESIIDGMFLNFHWMLPPKTQS